MKNNVCCRFFFLQFPAGFHSSIFIRYEFYMLHCDNILFELKINDLVSYIFSYQVDGDAGGHEENDHHVDEQQQTD